MIIRGREFNADELQAIKEIVASHPDISRRQLSLRICEHLNWRQPNGLLKDRACRDVLLRLAAKNEVCLPHPSYTLSTQPISVHQPEEHFTPVHLDGRIDHFGNLHFSLVSTLKQRRLWNYLIGRYHYLGLTTQVGRHLKFFLYVDKHLVGATAFTDAVLKLNLRDRWINWTSEQRSEHLHLIINNARFLILPSVKIKNLASKTLALAAKSIPDYWQHHYGYQPLLMETFIEKNRFKGSSYRAANWKYLGETIGKARSGMNYSWHGLTKQYYVYPLTKKTRERLRGECQ